MQVTQTNIPEVLVIEPAIYSDERGSFFESFHQSQFEQAVGYSVGFVQDDQSSSSQNVLRGLHYQTSSIQGKLIRVLHGEIFDVAVDVRIESPTFGRWVGTLLSSENGKQHWIPEGFAHGYYVTTDCAMVCYKTTDYYAPAHEVCIRWDDPTLAIRWPLDGVPILSSKDQNGLLFSEMFNV